MSTHVPAYKGNLVFCNQPSFKCFNKFFEDQTDALYLGLNEIHPVFLHTEHSQMNFDVVQNNSICDLQKNMSVLEYPDNYTKQTNSPMFYSPYKSVLSKAQHLDGLEILQALQFKKEVSEEDILILRQIEQKRKEEKLKFMKYLNEFSKRHREKMYAPAKQFVALYSLWYQHKVQLLIASHMNLSYNTYSGLPNVRLCDSTERIVEIEDVQVLDRSGEIPVWKMDPETFSCTTFKNNLNTYALIYDEVMENQEKFANAYEGDIISGRSNDGSSFKYCIGLESLLFLLTAGDYPDLPTEMFMDITDGLVTFHTPLPSRNCGWHTHTKVVEQAFETFQAALPDIRWLNLIESKDPLTTPIRENIPLRHQTNTSSQLNAALDYKSQLLPEHIRNANFTDSRNIKKLKPNRATVRWYLTENKSKEKLHLFTTLQQPPAFDVSAVTFFGGVTIKLEHKPRFGCEVMTKYELLKEWLTLRLLATSEEEVLHRLRLSTSTFELLLTEKIVRAQIEQQLLKLYNLRISCLLTGLFEFLNMLRNTPIGHYMLRFNSRFKDKLMLCTPSQEITQHSIFLHTLLQTEPCDIVFMTQHHFLPIDDNICSIIHQRHRVLPCSFLPVLKERHKPYSMQKKRILQAVKPEKLLFNDRNFILLKMQKKINARKANEKLLQKRCKQQQKHRRRARLRAKNKDFLEKQQEDNEVKLEIELDGYVLNSFKS